MLVACAAQTMRSREALAHRQTQLSGHGSAQHDLHGRVPQAALRHGCLVVRHVGLRAAHNAEALKTVAQTDGDDFGHQGIFGQRLDGCPIDIARRHVQVQHTGQNQLHRAALGTHDHVDTGQVAVKSALQMVRDQQQKANRSQAKGQQEDVEQRPHRPRPQVAPSVS